MFIAALLGVAAVAPATLPAVAQGEAEATLSVSQRDEGTDGAAAAVDVVLVGADELFAIDIELSFDPATTHIADADPTTEGVQVTIGPFLSPGFVAIHDVDSDAGVIRVAFTQVPPAVPVSGDGVVLSVLLDEAPDVGGIEVSAVSLARADGTAQPAVIEDSAGDGTTPAPTPGTLQNTPTPTPPGRTPGAGETPGSDETPMPAGTTATASPEGTATGEPTASVSPSPAVDSSSAEDDVGLPGWVLVAGGVGLVVALAGGALIVRSRAGA